MNELDSLLEKIDSSDLDVRDETEINKMFQDVIGKLFEQGKEDEAYIANVDRESFAFIKSFDPELDENGKKIKKEKGVKWKMKGTQKLEDGSELPLEWPDISKYSTKEFEQIKTRYLYFKKNLFAKTEFGLILYFTGFEKSVQFKTELAQSLFDLSKQYLDKTRQGGEKNFYSMDFFRSIKGAFLICLHHKIEPLFEEILNLLVDVHLSWDLKSSSSMRIILDISHLLNEEYGAVKNKVPFEKILSKNIEAADSLERKNIWGSIGIARESDKIEQKSGSKYFPWKKITAQYYESMADSAFEQGNLTAASFIETAFRIYKEIDDKESIKRTEDKYNKIRGKIPLGETREKMPEEYSKEISERIKKEIDSNDAKGIIKILVTLPMFAPLDAVEQSRKQTSEYNPLSAMMASSVQDKFGNTIDTFYTKDEIEEHTFWEAYNFHFQLGQQALNLFFWQALRKGNLNYESIIDYLKSTWMNTKFERVYGDIVPLHVVEPIIKNAFSVFNSVIKEEPFSNTHIIIMDSLVLKVEYLLRFFCERIGIMTFKPRNKAGQKLMMEKNIDDLFSELNALGILFPEDLKFMKYILTEKIGHNLRNRVAHGLMDFHEYYVEEIFIVLCIILKLANYKL